MPYYLGSGKYHVEVDHHDHKHKYKHAHAHTHHGWDGYPDLGSGPKANILFAASLNLGFTIIELIGGILTNSVAVLSDALHDLGDCLSLFGAYVAEKQAERPADSKRTFGYARVSLLSAVLSSLVLIVGSIYILIEAIERLQNPEPVAAGAVALLAVFGIVTNYIGYRRLHGGHTANERVLSWHLLEDVLGWVAVLIGALIMYFTGLFIIDAILTIAFTMFIIWGVVRNFREVINLFMEGVPAEINMIALKESIAKIEGVQSVHDIHIWSLDGAKNIFTGHVVLQPAYHEHQSAVYSRIKALLAEHRIVHTTIEFEKNGGEDCHDRCD